MMARKNNAMLTPLALKQLGADVWVDTQNGIAYSKSLVDSETRLLVHKGDSNVRVKGWAANEFAWRLAA
jgi:hypothetical protein